MKGYYFYGRQTRNGKKEEEEASWREGEREREREVLIALGAVLSKPQLAVLLTFGLGFVCASTAEKLIGWFLK